MFTERTSLGLDVHARSVRAAGIDMVTGEVVQRALPAPVPSWSSTFVDDLAAESRAGAGDVRGGPDRVRAGAGVAWAGHRCQVAAPSKLLRPSGTGSRPTARDALLLARLARNDDIVPVSIPTVVAGVRA